jgi:hypothetical protein
VTDLPRFTAGSLGPIGFNQVNEMMRRLDALRPLIESVEISQEGLGGKKETTMLVYAKQSTHPDFAGRYDWREIAIRPKSEEVETETVAGFEDEDWDEIELDVSTRGGVVLDEKGQEADTYAISVAAFSEGFAFCFARRSLDGTRRYVLVPLAPETSGGGAFSDLFRIESIVSEGSQIPYTTGGGSAACFVYTARRMAFTRQGNQVALAQESDEVFIFYDLGLANENHPPISTSATLTAVPLQVGTFFRGSVVELAPGFQIGYVALPPRLGVECP